MPDQPLRIFVGPQDVSGALMWGYRCGYRYWGADSRLIVDRKHQFSYPYDELHELKGGRIAIRYRKTKFLVEMLSRFDLFHTFSGLSLLPKNLDVPLFKIMDKKLITTFIGSDIRCNIDVLNGDLDAKDCNFCMLAPPCKKKRKEKLVKFWERNGDLIISAMGCSQILEHRNIPYHLLRLPIDLKHWKRFKPRTDTNDSFGYIIIHATSRTDTKGTYIFIDAINRLKKEGYKFTAKIIQNKTNSYVREWLNVADIVFDQINVGWFGSFAVESMAMGNPVLGSISDVYRQRLKKFHPNAPELPIINVTKATLYDEIKALLEDDSRRHKVAKKSREYAVKMHRNTDVCKELMDAYRRL